MAAAFRAHAVSLLVAAMIATGGFVNAQSGGWDSSASEQPAAELRHPETSELLVLFPHSYSADPQLPSPWQTPDAKTLIVGRTNDDRFTLLPVTVENGEPISWLNRQFTKGQQLEIDGKDFPTLAAKGVHDHNKLDEVRTITGRPLEELNRLGRPNGLSSAGFFASDEDVISVLKGDDLLVRKLGLTHPQLARPLFHVWNSILLELEYASRQGRAPRFWRAFSPITYRSHPVVVRGEGTKGFQQSLFDDEIKGTGDIKTSRALTRDEAKFLKQEYSHLTLPQQNRLIAGLTRMRTSEMEPYYVMRYGFYEGHTSWRVDPITIAFIFGLRSLNEIEAAFPGQLYGALTDHHLVRPVQ